MMNPFASHKFFHHFHQIFTIERFLVRLNFFRIFLMARILIHLLNQKNKNKSKSLKSIKSTDRIAVVHRLICFVMNGVATSEMSNNVRRISEYVNAYLLNSHAIRKDHSNTITTMTFHFALTFPTIDLHNNFGKKHFQGNFKFFYKENMTSSTLLIV